MTLALGHSVIFLHEPSYQMGRVFGHSHRSTQTAAATGFGSEHVGVAGEPQVFITSLVDDEQAVTN